MKDLALYTRQLAAMLRGGLPLVTALQQLQGVFPHKGYRRAARTIGQGLVRGHSLHALLRDHPRLFPDFYVKMVEAGETGDSLLPALDTLADYYSERHRIKSRLLRILFYPLLLISVALVSGLFALWNVVPTFSSLYTTLGTEVPPATQRVFAIAAYLTPTRLGLGLGAGGALLAAAAIILAKKLKWPVLAKLPLVGAISCYWFSRVCSMIISAGHTLELALTMVGTVSSRGPAPGALAQIRGGASLYSALAGSPGILRSFIAQGEATGQLPAALARAAEYYRSRVEEGLDDFQRILEPVSVLLVGGAVALMLLVLMLPMLQLARAF